MSEDRIIVQGKATGDGECWCMIVSQDQYRHVKGDDDWRLEVPHRREFTEDDRSPIKYDEDSPWHLYPDDILEAIGVPRGAEVSIEVKLVGFHLACGCSSFPTHVKYLNPEQEFNPRYYCRAHAPDDAVPYKREESD